MNVRKVKRMSKRIVSTLLSVLMVLSVFTVCMVGTVTNVLADDNTFYVHSGDTGYIYYDNSNTGWDADADKVYFYYGKEGSEEGSCRCLELTRIDR